MIDVYWFLPSPSSGAYSEAAPYGPSPSMLSSSFSNGLAIDVSNVPVLNCDARACVSGSCFAMQDPGGITCSIILQPRPMVTNALKTALDCPQRQGGGAPVFVYRNVVTNSARATALAVYQKAGNADPDGLADAFISGTTYAPLNAGDAIGVVGTDPNGNQWLTFEIAFVPGSLFSQPPVSGNLTPYARAWELLGATSTTRRLDPTTFYYTILNSTAGTAQIAAGDQNNPLWNLVTKRVLLEVRDAWDDPFTDSFSYTIGNGPPQTESNARGAVVLGDATASNLAFSVSATNYVATVLPSGVKSQTNLLRSVNAPDHVSVQLAYLGDLSNSIDDSANSWFVPNVDSYPKYSSGNSITPIRDGARVVPDDPNLPAPIRDRTGYLPQIAHAFEELTAPGHFAHFVAWGFNGSFDLIPEQPGSSVYNYVKQAITAGAAFGLIMWIGRLHDVAMAKAQLALLSQQLNTDQISFITDTSLNKSPVVWGSYHQKIHLFNGENGMFAFLGGMDVATNRQDSPRHNAKDPYHDLSCKVLGPAVNDIYQIVVERWNYALGVPDNQTNAVNGLPSLPSQPPALKSAGTADTYVQVGRTYAPIMQYPFSPQGSLQNLNAFLRAIALAKRFIYIEDQFMTPYAGVDDANVSDDTIQVVTALRDALSRIDYLILMVVDDCGLGINPFFRFHRMHFIDALLSVAPDKVYCFYIVRDDFSPPKDELATYDASTVPEVEAEDPNSGFPTLQSGDTNDPDQIYVHPKLWIVDDVLYKIGSANVNRRSYTNDGEADVICLDGALLDGARAGARQLRLDMWGEHLRMEGAQTDLLQDHKQALQYWIARAASPNARVRQYQYNIGVLPGTGNPGFWDALDPDGRTP